MPYFQNWMSTYSINSGDKVLCAVSGGIDSMVMLDLFIKANIHIDVVHVNYQLREIDSDNDQALVENICAKHKITCHIKTTSKPSNCNTQEWARNVRYDFIETLNEIHHYNFITTAHHQQDQLETILLSIFKGYSLQTIKPKRDAILRPLLDISKQDILDYASANNIKYRTDKSNLSSNYDRNYLRNDLIPSLRNRFQNFDKRVLKFAERQTEKNNLWSSLIEEAIKEFSSIELNNLNNYTYEKIDLKILNKVEGKNILIHYFINNYSFNKNQIEDLLKSDNAGASIMNKKFISSKDENFIYAGKIEGINESKIVIKKDELPYWFNNLHIDHLSISLEVKSPSKLKVDFDKLQFPLILRKASEKDKFYAFGLKGGKTQLTKFLKDKGIPTIRRSQEYILIDAKNQIIVPGLEIDYRLKVTNSSKTVLFIDLQDKTT